MINYLISLLLASQISVATPPAELNQVSSEMYCLVQNVYFEAGNQAYAGKRAVAEVTINRLKDKSYPDTICGVVKQAEMSKWWKEQYGKNVPVKHKCQFSWYCDGKSDKIKYSDTWRSSYIAAHDALKSIRHLTEGSTHYHATYVNPNWAKRLTFIVRIGDHIFYR
jgi:N-acetylmuramoyl-L-alanine amidase|tara:strand:+ start:763 stop:1260 length:498 start_codon:yes stop_codon:yes gene_type:complete